MKKSRMLVVMVAVFVFVCVLVGCKHGSSNEGRSNKDKMTDFLYKYGDAYAEQIYKETRYVPMGVTFEDFNHKITSLVIKSIKTKEGADVTYHLVKCKMGYRFTIKDDKKITIDYIRYMSLAIEEDGYGNMMVDATKSKEIFIAGRTDEMMAQLFPDEMRDGEKMIQ